MDQKSSLSFLTLGHAHTPSPRTSVPTASDAPEILAFAESIVNGEAPQSAWVSYVSPHPIVSAELNYTRGVGLWENRQFITVPATLDQASGKVSHEIVAGTTGYYFNLTEDRNRVTSSEYVSPEATTPVSAPK